MKKFVLLFLCCLLTLTLIACGGNDTKPSDDNPEATLSQITVEEIDTLKEGESAKLCAFVTGKMGDKLYIADDTGAYELTGLSNSFVLRCGVGQYFDFTVESTQDGLTATDYKKLDGSKTFEAATISDLSSLEDNLYKKVSIKALTVTRIVGNIFDSESDANIFVSDGKSECAILISNKLAKADRKNLADALKYPTKGDSVDILGAFVTKADGVAVLELGAKEQASVTEKEGKINIERIEKDVADISLDLGEKLVYTPEIYPENATNLDYLFYKVSDTSVAYIDETGSICARAYGKTYLHIESGDSKVVIPLYVEPKLDFGYDKWTPTRVDETPRIVTNIDELRREFLAASIGGYREIYVDFNLNTPIREADIYRLLEREYLGGMTITVIGGDWTEVYKDELIKFTFKGWIGEELYGPYEIPTEESGVNFIDAAQLLRQKYVIENSPYKRGEGFEDFPITKKNSGVIEVYNPRQLVWALEFNLLPTFPIENSKAEYIYEQAKDVLRKIITDDMTEVQKCKAIFDYICQNAVYAVDYYTRREATDYYAPEQQVVGFFERGRVVCEGYSETFSLLAGIEGIKAHRVYGHIERDILDGHMWNAVYLDGKLYELCATQSDNTMRGWPDNWFDEEAEGAGHDTHSYRHFLVTNEYFKAHYPYQTPTGEKYFAYHDVLLIDKLPNKDFDYIIESSAELEKVLSEVIGLGIKGNYYISLEFDGFTPSFDMLEPIMKKLGYKGEYTYSTPIESLNGKGVYHTIYFHDVTK